MRTLRNALLSLGFSLTLFLSAPLAAQYQPGLIRDLHPLVRIPSSTNLISNFSEVPPTGILDTLYSNQTTQEPTPLEKIQNTLGAPQTTVEAPSFAYRRPTGHDQFRNFERSAFGVYAVGRSVFVGLILQAENSPPDWGQGWGPYGERIASSYGRYVVGTGTRYGVAAMLHQDAKGYKCDCKGFMPRLKHALASSFTARAGDDGHRVISPAPIGAPYVAAFTELAWLPQRYGWKDGLRDGTYGLLYGIGENVAREFIPLNF